MKEKVHKKQLQMLATEEERQKELARHVIAEERKKHEEVLLIIQESRLLLEEVERLAIDKDQHYVAAQMKELTDEEDERLASTETHCLKLNEEQDDVET